MRPFLFYSIYGAPALPLIGTLVAIIILGIGLEGDSIPFAIFCVLTGVSSGADFAPPAALQVDGVDVYEHRHGTVRPRGGGWRAEAGGLIKPTVITLDSAHEMRWRYAMRVGPLVFQFEDVFIAQNANQLLAHMTMRKWGITWARLTSLYERDDRVARPTNQKYSG